MTETVKSLYGVRCGDALHEGFGYRKVYGTSLSETRARSLVAGVRCYELVVSHDNGTTWEARP